MTREEILAGESRNMEFKVSRPEKSIKYMKSVVAFANGKGGRIVFGIDDETREIVGIPEEIIFQEMDAVTNAISDSCVPVIIPDIYPQTIDGKTIIIVEIGAGKQKPYYIKQDGITDGVYMRVSGTSRKADRAMTQEMYYESEGRSYDTVIRRDLTVTDGEIAKLCSEMKEVALAHCKNEVQRQSVRDVTRIEGLYRQDIYELPPDSIRELIINAVMNCSFLQPSHIQVAVYDDRLEITSPGGLMPGVTIERMKEGYSQIRNRALAHAFSYMNLIEGWGTGIPRLFREMKEYGLAEPEFIDMEIAFRVNLYRASVTVPDSAGEVPDSVEKVPDSVGEVPDSAGKVPDSAGEVPDSAGKVPDSAGEVPDNPDWLPGHQALIYQVLIDNGQITSVEVESLLGIKQRRARTILKMMAEKGIIRKVGAARATKYILNEE